MPDLPSHYLPREADLAGLKQKLLAEDALLGITGKSSARRRPGYAVLTAALAQDSEVRQTFPEDIYWLTAGQKPNLLDLQNRLLRQLTGSKSKETLITEQKVKGALREAIEGRTPEQQRKPVGEKMSDTRRGRDKRCSRG